MQQPFPPPLLPPPILSSRKPPNRPRTVPKPPARLDSLKPKGLYTPKPVSLSRTSIRPPSLSPLRLPRSHPPPPPQALRNQSNLRRRQRRVGSEYIMFENVYCHENELSDRDILCAEFVAEGKGSSDDFGAAWDVLDPKQKKVSMRFTRFCILSYLTLLRTQAKTDARVCHLPLPITYVANVPVTQRRREGKKKAK